MMAFTTSTVVQSDYFKLDFKFCMQIFIAKKFVYAYLTKKLNKCFSVIYMIISLANQKAITFYFEPVTIKYQSNNTKLMQLSIICTNTKFLPIIEF